LYRQGEALSCRYRNEKKEQQKTKQQNNVSKPWLIEKINPSDHKVAGSTCSSSEQGKKSKRLNYEFRGKKQEDAGNKEEDGPRI